MSAIIKQRFSDVLKILLCGIGLITTFYTILDLTYFLSIPNSKVVLLASKDSWLTTSWALLVNMVLLTVFIAQHSLMANNKVKNYLNSLGLQVASRSLYVISTSGALMLLIRNWKIAPDVVLWNINFNYKPLLWSYVGIHTVAWIIVYVANICTDVTELLGIKQLYYSLVNLPDPSDRKSHQLKRLNVHMRHPSFLAFFLIFWFYPVMTLDRLLLATILTSYMYIAWNTDGQDYYYQKSQYQRKYHELQRLNKQYY